MSARKKSPAHHRSANVLLCCAALLLPWIAFLAVTMRSDEYVVARWGTAWVGLDIAEAIGLAGTALLVRRRDVRVSPVAAATGTLFLADAWFDTVTSHTQAAYLQSLFLAAVAELPLAMFCMVIAWRSAQPAGPAREARSVGSVRSVGAVGWLGDTDASRTRPVRRQSARRSGGVH